MDIRHIWEDYPIVFSCAIILFAVFLAYVASHWFAINWKKLPPGPIGLPILGYLPFLGKSPHFTFSKLSRKYGNIFHLYLGKSLVVVLNDYGTIKEALVKQADTFKGKPPDVIFDESKNENVGLVNSDGELWRQHRKFVMTHLYTKGIGTSHLEPLILNEIQHCLKEIDKQCGNEIEIKDLLNTSLTNNVLSILSSQRFNYDHPMVTDHRKLFNQFKIYANAFAWQTFIPRITLIPGMAILLKKKEKINLNQQFLAIVNTMINSVKTAYVEGEDVNYIQAFLTERNSRLKQNKDDFIFTDASLLYNTRDLLAAGNDTSAVTLHWALLYMIVYPEVQQNVQMEIDAVIGLEREPTYNDRMQTPYTEAVICEIHRVVSLTPVNLRRNIKETTLHGYYIPKDTVILANLWAVHNDPKLWNDPENFRPERFIGANGELIQHPYLIPFSLGKRACVGEQLAKMQLYLYFTSLLQRFTFVSRNGQKPSLDVNRSIFRAPECSTVGAINRLQQKSNEKSLATNILNSTVIPIIQND
ncbi:hypothetical protein CHUAL_005499 [Chamberlinius hualienensis]